MPKKGSPSRVARAACVALGLSLAACGGALGSGRGLPVPGATEGRHGTAHRTDEVAALLARGEVITEPLDFEQGGNSYVGGVARGLVKATPEQILAALEDVESLARVLPRTKSARVVDSTGTRLRLELVQGNSIIEAKYTVVLAETVPGRVVFHLDRTRPHDIDDVYGYFTVTRFDAERSEVTVAAAVDIGSSLAHALFGRRVQNVILSTHHAMRDYFRGGSAPDPTAVVAHNSAR